MIRPKKSPVYHKYERFYWPNGKAYYRCMLPGCSHHLALAEMAVGRESICWGHMCNRLVTITKEDVRRLVKYPMCERCKQERQEKREELMNIK